jgi:hypothetical protein
VLTEESLTTRANVYLAKGAYDTLSDARKALRYSVADSPHFSELEDSLATVNALMAPFEEKIDETAGYELLAKAAIAALQELDEQRLFGNARQREKLLLLIITFDTDVAWFLPSARRLNSAAAFRRLEKETRIEGTFRTSLALAVSGDGRFLYSHGTREISRKTEESVSEVVAYNISTPRLKRRWTFSFPSTGDTARGVTCTRDNKTLFVLRTECNGSHPETVLMRFSSNQSKPLQTTRLEGEAGGIAVSHDNSRVAITCDKTVHILDDKLSTIQRVQLDTRGRKMHFLSSGELLIATGLGLFRMDAAFNVAHASPTYGYHDLALDDAEKLLVVKRRTPSPPSECGVDILSLPSLIPVRTILLPNHQAGHPAISPDGRLLAFEANEVGSFYRIFVAVFETATGREIARRKIELLNDLKFLRDNRTLAIGRSAITKSEPVELWTVPEP